MGTDLTSLDSCLLSKRIQIRVYLPVCIYWLSISETIKKVIVYHLMLSRPSSPVSSPSATRRCRPHSKVPPALRCPAVQTPFKRVLVLLCGPSPHRGPDSSPALWPLPAPTTTLQRQENHFNIAKSPVKQDARRAPWLWTQPVSLL